jgi:WD40 repeat protein
MQTFIEKPNQLKPIFLAISIILGLQFRLPGQVNSASLVDRLRSMAWVAGYSPAVALELGDSALSAASCYKLIVDSSKYGICFTGTETSSSSICDTAGNPLFFTAYGGTPFNVFACQVPGYANVNSPKGAAFRDDLAKNIFQLTLILPKQASEYYVFTTGSSDDLYLYSIQTGLWQYAACDVLSYYTVDMSMNEGRGQVTSINNIIYEGSEPLSLDRMTAVRHANGRDWWLVKPHKNKQQMYTWLVTPTSVTLHEAVIQNPIQYDDRYVRGQITFSANGDKFAMVHNQDSNQAVYVYNFDRCAGTFSNYRRIPIATRRKDDGLQGVAFSPNGNLLYVSSYFEVNQVDLNDTTNNAITLIAKDAPNLYAALALADNGHIYVSNFHATHSYMSYIHQPNKKGLACDYREDGLHCQYTNLMNVPNVPNFKLGGLVGSPCDTLDKASPTPKHSSWVLYPNPVNTKLKIAVPLSSTNSAAVSISTILGQQVVHETYSINASHEVELDVTALATGVYIVHAAVGAQNYVAKFFKE